MIIDLSKRHIDSGGWYKVSVKEAKALCAEAPGANRLPRPGFERRVCVNGDPAAWLARTSIWGKTVWAVHGLSPNIAAYRNNPRSVFMEH